MEMKGFFLCDQIKADLHVTWVQKGGRKDSVLTFDPDAILGEKRGM